MTGRRPLARADVLAAWAELRVELARADVPEPDQQRLLDGAEDVRLVLEASGVDPAAPLHPAP